MVDKCELECRFENDAGSGSGTFLAKIYFITILAFFFGNVSIKTGIYFEFQLLKWGIFFVSLLFFATKIVGRNRTIGLNFRLLLFLLFCVVTSYNAEVFQRTMAFVVMFIIIILESHGMVNYFIHNGIERSFFQPLLKVVKLIVPLTFFAYLLGIEWGRTKGGRITTWVDNPNTLGMMMYILLPVTTYYVLYGAKKKILILLLFFMQIILLYKSGSRASLGAGLIGITLVFMSQRKMRVLKVIFIAVFIPLLFVIIVGSAFIAEGNILSLDSLNFLARDNKTLTSQMEHNKNKFDTITDEKLTFLLSGRWEVWQEAFTAIEEHPYIGYGLGYEDAFLNKLKDEGKVLFHFGSNLHCSYLALILETGFIGAFLALFFLLAPVFAYCKMIVSANYKKEYYVVLGICLAGLFDGCFESWIFRIGNLCVFIFWPAMLMVMNAKKCGFIKNDI